MSKKPTLVVLAAGLGSRYGGIKQLDGFGPNGERIIDYTIYDALQAGYGKIVFVIRKEIEKDFTEAILEKWEGKGDLRVVFQELDSLPLGYKVPEGRVKPWGTAHAVWMSEPEVDEPFAIVNADDFYGRGSLKALADHLSTIDDETKAGCMVGYALSKTITEHGSVSRGICEVDQASNLQGIVERTKIAKNGDGRIFYEEDAQKTYLENDTIVSMNLMGFSSNIFEEIREGFAETYEASKENLKAEYYIPKVLNGLVETGIDVPVIKTSDNWFGVTYTEDKQWVTEQLLKLTDEGAYPNNLFN